MNFPDIRKIGKRCVVYQSPPYGGLCSESLTGRFWCLAEFTPVRQVKSTFSILREWGGIDLVR
jgi:hypothetical protein